MRFRSTTDAVGVTRYRWLDSPCGRLLVAGDEDALHTIAFDRERRRAKPGGGWIEDDGAVPDAVEQLTAYFRGRLVEFDLVLAPRGTEFQRAVWKAVAAIPFGETATYGGIAARIGRPSAVRAVGAANGANPLPIVIPCHRVIGSDGRLTGYGGGLDLKEKLLELERSAAHPRLF